MVVDGGPSGERLLSCLGDHLPFWDRKIEMVVNTHPQKDHLGGLDELVERYEVDRLVINGVFGGGKDAEKLRELIGKKGIEVVLPKVGDTFRMGSLQFDILWPVERIGDKLAWIDAIREDLVGEMVLGKNTDINEVSVVGILSYGEFEVLLTGDIGKNEEKKLLDGGDLMDIDVLKVAHHGSKYSNSREFIEMVDPEIAVIQVGKNHFGHPTQEVLNILEGLGIKVFRNDLNGKVEIVSNGERYWIEY